MMVIGSFVETGRGDDGRGGDDRRVLSRGRQWLR